MVSEGCRSQHPRSFAPQSQTFALAGNSELNRAPQWGLEGLVRMMSVELHELNGQWSQDTRYLPPAFLKPLVICLRYRRG